MIVESPAKAKTINQYLGNNYKVVASYGHVRDLPPKNGSVRPDDDFAMDWVADTRGQKTINELIALCKQTETLYFATDPDREGEAISWHLYDEFNKRGLLKDKKTARVIFHEITKKAVCDAIENPRLINQKLVDAYLARRALDYLVGFTLSPVLWRKLPGAKSAGRVQSVSLKLICERESEIEAFNPIEYWQIMAQMTDKKQMFQMRLHALKETIFKKHDISSQQHKDQIIAQIKDCYDFIITDSVCKNVKRQPIAPFTTSTLQQESSRKLGFTTSRTMQIAQKLYEGIDIAGQTQGLITYMRTDSTNLAASAITATRDYIQQYYGDAYLPEKPRYYQSKQKNAQEAHEAIRPTNVALKPKELQHYLTDEQLKLYELIWKRMVACQMNNAIYEQRQITARDTHGVDAIFKASGQTLIFDGYQKLYIEKPDDAHDDDDSKQLLPNIQIGDYIVQESYQDSQHFTQPPPRYSEASLVKKMEELGIGRPSTYASIIKILQERDYVKLDKRRFIPEDRGWLVTGFLNALFSRYIAYDFTANLEDQLDDIANGDLDWQQVLKQFWYDFYDLTEEILQKPNQDIRALLNDALQDHYFPKNDNNAGNPRQCPKCQQGILGLNTGKYGIYISCSDYPNCKFTRQIGDNTNHDDDTDNNDYPRLLGAHPDNALPIILKKGPYGIYVEIEDGTKKPKRASLLKKQSPDTITLEIALNLLSLPRLIGQHPETKKDIKAGVGRYGPYLLHDGKFTTLPADDDVLTIGMNRAVDILSTKQTKSTGRDLGIDETTGNKIMMKSGRYGAYVTDGKINASLPASVNSDDITLEDAVQLIKERAAKAPPSKKSTKKAVKKSRKKSAKKV